MGKMPLLHLYTSNHNTVTRSNFPADLTFRVECYSGDLSREGDLPRAYLGNGLDRCCCDPLSSWACRRRRCCCWPRTAAAAPQTFSSSPSTTIHHLFGQHPHKGTTPTSTAPPPPTNNPLRFTHRPPAIPQRIGENREMGAEISLLLDFMRSTPPPPPFSFPSLARHAMRDWQKEEEKKKRLSCGRRES